MANHSLAIPMWIRESEARVLTIQSTESPLKAVSRKIFRRIFKSPINNPIKQRLQRERESLRQLAIFGKCH